MITHDKLRIYRQFDGNDEKWSWAGSPGSEIITGREWLEIDKLLQEVTPVKKGFASAEYEARIRTKLKEMTESESVAQEIFELA